MIERGIAALDKKLSRILERLQYIVDEIRDNEDDVEELR